eukprot:scaffold602_cov298-Pinguiococcus_pyrenoidosus.AAC.33
MRLLSDEPVDKGQLPLPVLQLCVSQVRCRVARSSHERCLTTFWPRSDCLVAHVKPLLPPKEQELVDETVALIETMETHFRDIEASGQTVYPRDLEDLAQVKKRLAGYIAADCPLSGVLAIESVDLPLVPDAAEDLWAL